MSGIIATGSKTIIDLSDGKSLSIYLGSNQPRTQIYDTNTGVYNPDWSNISTNLEITPIVYANEKLIPNSSNNLSITWERREGSGTPTPISSSGESVSGNVLTVTQNKLSSISSGLLTYIAHAQYTDEDTGLPINATSEITFALIKTGQNSKNVSISGEQVFKYPAGGGTPSPTQITLTARLQNATVSKWRYKSGSSWVDYPVSSDNPSITSSTLIVKPDEANVWQNETATIKVETNVSGLEDIISLYKVSDGSSGAAGTDASVAFLTNENITFAASNEGKVAATVVNCEVVAYTGTTAVTPTVGTPTGAPTGMTVTPGSPDTTRKIVPITISIADQATLGGPGEQNGTINIPITSPITTTLQITWSKVNTGATGTAGENAVVFTLYAPEGTTFINQGGDLPVATQAYNGSTPITSGATYAWYKYTSGQWVVIPGATSDSYTVDGDDVISTGSYRCIMTYNSKQYQDVITFIDKTDNYQAEIESTGGEIFKNTQGYSYLICRIWQNGQEVDAQKSTTYGNTAPSSPAAGAFYYKHVSGQSNTHTTALMRYSGSAWVDVTNDAEYKHEKTYTWYRRNKDGDPVDGDGVSFATGKIIYVDGSDVDSKAVFTCEVS